MTVFKEDDLVEILRLTYQDKKTSRYIGELYGCSKSSIGNFLRKETYLEFWEAHEDKPIAAGTTSKIADNRKKLVGKKFVITSAQNNTHLHNDFFNSLMRYCEEEDAQFIVGTYIYNKNGFQNAERNDIWFDPKLRPFIIKESIELAQGLVYCGEIQILPTAKSPITGMHNYTEHGDSIIIPHSKLQLESVPTPFGLDAKLVYTTGTVTTLNYRPQRAGQLAEPHHAFSALVVEVDSDGDWFVRQLNAEKETGCFYDLTKYYTPEHVILSDQIEGLNLGDLHTGSPCEDVTYASWDKNNLDSIVDVLRPKHIFCHDSYSNERRNHHNVGSAKYLFSQYARGEECIRTEVEETVAVFEDIDRDFTQLVCVDSNHDRSLGTWLDKSDFKRDPVNALFYLEMQHKVYSAINSSEGGFHTFESACETVSEGSSDRFRFLRLAESYRIAGDIECGFHGSEGSNGSRPSTATFVKQGLKFNIGHQHSCGIKDGVYVAGLSGSLNQKYNASGGSSWSHSHIITYANGKRTIVTLKNGKWRG